MPELKIPAFNMGDEDKQIGERQIRNGENRVCKILEHVYDNDEVRRSTRQSAEMQVFACKRFEHWISNGSNYWAAVTSSLIDTLGEYPLGVI